jgi:hypothetical protein
MLHLLTETHIFIALPNDCLCQMTGEPVIHMTPVAPGQPSTTPVIKGSVQAGKRPFPFPNSHQDGHLSKRLKMPASIPVHRQRTGTTVSKCVIVLFCSSSSSAYGRGLDGLLRISCLFALGYFTPDHDIYLTRPILLLVYQTNVRAYSRFTPS